MFLKKIRHFFIAFGVFSTLPFGIYAQTCTVTATQNWTNPGPNCVEGGNAGSATVIIIPFGKSITFNHVVDTWTGTRIEVYGTLSIVADVSINATIMVKNGGYVNLGAKLFLGSGANCGYGMGVETGGLVNVGGTGSDRLNVCGVEIMKGNGSCNNCGGTNSGKCAYNGDPYCEPAAGFAGPTGYGETGYTTILPIRLVGFSAEVVGNRIEFKWATEKEENFDHFEIERAGNDLQFTTVATIPAAGSPTAYTEYTATDKNPLIGTHYYRLKAVDLDQSYEYVKLVPVEFTDSKEFAIVPNPSSGSLIKYQINFDPSANDYVVLIDAVGNELQRKSVEGTQNEFTPVKTLKPGTYLLRYVSAKYQHTTRLFVRE